MTTESRRSYSEGAQKIGQRNRRVAVPVPNKVKDLEKHASCHFGHMMDGPYAHFHQGDQRQKLETDSACERVRPHDVIVVEGRRKVTQGDWATTHARDYKEPEQEASPARRKQANIDRPVPKSAPFEGRSHAHENYVAHQIEFKPQPRQVSSPTMSKIPFEGDSTYRSQYLQHPTDAAKSPKTPLKPAAFKSARFEGESDYRREYIEHPMTSPSSRTPLKTRELTPSKFDGKSHYSDHYVQHPIEAKPTQANRFKKNQASSTPFEGTSTYRNNYIEHELSKAPRSPGKQQVFSNKIPFEGKSDYDSSYIAHKIKVPQYVYIEPRLEVA